MIGGVTRKRCSADFKAKVALEAIKGEQFWTELAAKRSLHQAMIATWKCQAVAGRAATFSDKSEAVSEADVAKLRAKIGQLVVERDLLSRVFYR